jgi:hypothetical protein
VGAISPKEAGGLLDAVGELHQTVVEWLNDSHPDLAP